MLLVAAVTSATLDPTHVVDEVEWIPINYRIDSRVRRQVPSTDAKEETAASTNVPIIDGTTLLKDLAIVQSPTDAVRQGTSSLITLPIDTSAISLDACIFIGLKIKIIINILDPLVCSRICASDANCTHFTHEPLKSGGTCTLHSAPGLGKEWSTPAPKNSGATCGQIPNKKKCVSSNGSLINLCVDLGLKIILGLL
uniref:Brain chitinase and chia n=2 Tax=Daphnia magna TaxID=35525 RepID=A0A0P6FWE7_9CRUS